MVPMSSWRRRWSLLMLLGLLALSPAVDATNGAGGVTYYGVENDPERSTSGNDSAAAVRAATGAAGELPVRQSRTGQQILDDLDQLVRTQGEAGRLRPGLFVFHYSGHGSAQTPAGPAFIGTRDGVIDTDRLVDRLITITGERTTVLFLVDSCGAGNLQNSLNSRVRDEDGHRLNYTAVMGTRAMTAEDGGRCPRQGPVSIGEKLKEGLARAPNGRSPADANRDGTVSAQEAATYVQAQGDGFSSQHLGTDERLAQPVNGIPLINPAPPVQRAQPAASDPQRSARSGSADSMDYDAALQRLRFTDHVFVDTGHAADPLVGSPLLIPDLVLQGELEPGMFVFDAPDPMLRVTRDGATVLTALLDRMLYDQLRNTLTGELSELSVAPGFRSPWLDAALALLDAPPSPARRGDLGAFLSYTPDGGLLALTDHWKVSGSTAGTDGLRIAYRVSEPALPGLLGIGLLAGCLLRWRGSVAARRDASG